MKRKMVLLLASAALAVLMASGVVLAQTSIPPDLTIDYHYGPERVSPDQGSIYYEWEIENKGASTAAFPQGTVIASFTYEGAASARCSAPSGYSCNQSADGLYEIVSQANNTIGVGGSQYMWAYMDAPRTDGKMTQLVTLDPKNIIAEVNETNNTSRKVTYVGTPPGTDLSVTQTDNPDPVNIGSYVYYTVTVTNNGEDTAFNAVLRDDLPQNATYEYAYSDVASCNYISEYGAVVCPLRNIASGDSITIEVQVKTSGIGTISNTATVSSDYGDPEASNDTATEDTLVQDTGRPSGNITINGGRTYTNTRAVNLALSASDPQPGTGVAQMRFRNGGNSTWSTWQTYSTSKSWRLTSGAGKKTVYVQYMDQADNVSANAQDSITYRP